MKVTDVILEELKAEMDSTVRVFEALTDDIFDFSPHEKSKTVAELADHMVAIPAWTSGILAESELDWSKYTPPAPVTNVKELVDTYKNNMEIAVKAFENVSDEDLQAEWTMKNGDFTFFTVPKHMAIQKLIISHTVHHRAQMGVNLRLNNISVPASYVSSADENLFL